MNTTKSIKQEFNDFNILIDSKKASRMLAISPRKLFQMTKDGQIPFMKMGKCVRFRVADLEAWTQEQTQLSRDDHGSVGSM